MLCYLKLQFIAALLTTVYFCSVTYKIKHCPSCHEHRKCTEFDFENCENKCCTNEAEKRIIVCYFTNWAWYRRGIAKFTPENINASLCTHINYAFASFDNETHTIKSSDPWADIDNKFYQLLVNLAKGVKVLLSIGGWNNSGASVGWSRMFNNATARAVFVKSVVEFIKHYNFSGLDVDYEYPACPQGNRSAGFPTDAENFNKLISELKDAFNGKYLLTVTVSAGQANLKECYNISELCRIPDWINVMTYDYHSSSEGLVGANAPICGTGINWGVYNTLLYLTSVANCPAKQLVLGVPTYGQSYTLADTSKHRFGVKASGPGDAGAYTQSAGTLAYYESCLINKYFGLKGAMIWTLDYDDFTNSCGCGVYPLLKTLNQQLRCLNVSCTKFY